MRLTEFWERMRAQFGEEYAASVAKDYVLASLGERTVERALADGVEPKAVWRAICESFDVPGALRLRSYRPRLRGVLTLSGAITRITRPRGPISAA